MKSTLALTTLLAACTPQSTHVVPTQNPIYLHPRTVSNEFGSPVDSDELYQELAHYMTLDTNVQRMEYAEHMFAEAGYKTQRQEIDEKYSNVIAVKKGETQEMVYVGAHYDRVHEGKGVLDNGSGTVVVSNLAEALKDVPTHYSYTFILYGLEEEGLIGSEVHASSLTREERDNFMYIMNFDMVGEGNNTFHPNLASDGFEKAIRSIDRQRRMHLLYDNLPKGYSTDSVSYTRTGLPGFTISNDDYEILHTPNDTIEVMDKDELYEAFQLGLDIIYLTEQSHL